MSNRHLSASWRRQISPRKEYKRSRHEYDITAGFLDAGMSSKRSTISAFVVLDDINTIVPESKQSVNQLSDAVMGTYCIQPYTKDYNSILSSFDDDIVGSSQESPLKRNASHTTHKTLHNHAYGYKNQTSKYFDVSINHGFKRSSDPFEEFKLSRAQPKIKLDRTLTDGKREQFQQSEESLDLSQGLVGLKNLGNTCYMNAVLQCLLHCDRLVRYFTQYFEDSHIHESSQLNGELAAGLRQLYQKFYNRDNHSSPIKPTYVKEIIAKLSEQFDNVEQHDAHELLRFLIDGLSEELKFVSEDTETPLPLSEQKIECLKPIEQGNYWWTRHLSKNSSLCDIFCGQFRSTVTCTVCNNASYCFDPFLDLSLSIPSKSLRKALEKKIKSSYKKGFVSLYDCLESFVNVEALSNNDMTNCQYCKKLQECKKTLQIEKAPEMLVIHLKRFNNARRKKNDVVTFPVSGLDITAFLSTDVNDTSEPLLYDLFAICHHKGTVNYGHYIA